MRVGLLAIRRSERTLMAWWRRGYAADCKSVYPGSIPGQASISRSADAELKNDDLRTYARPTLT